MLVRGRFQDLSVATHDHELAVAARAVGCRMHDSRWSCAASMIGCASFCSLGGKEHAHPPARVRGSAGETSERGRLSRT